MFSGVIWYFLSSVCSGLFVMFFFGLYIILLIHLYMNCVLMMFSLVTRAEN